MAVVRRTIERSPAVVFAVLADPSTYPLWLVGCKDIRRIDEDWPSVGSAFHHRVGVAGPVTVADSTKVLEMVDDTVLSLQVRARPFGRGRATFRLSPTQCGAAEATVVELDEVPIGVMAPTKPLADPFIDHRNRTSLARLADYITSTPTITDT